MKRFVVTSAAAGIAALSAYAAAASRPAPADYDAFFRSPSPLTQERTAHAATRHVVGEFAKSAKARRFGYPSSFDKKLGVTTFLWAPSSEHASSVAPLKFAKAAEARARDALQGQAFALGLTKQTVADARLLDLDTRGPMIARFQQMAGGVEVFNRRINVLMDKDLKPVAISGYFAPVKSTLKNAPAPGPSFRQSAEQSIAAAFAQMGGQLQASALHAVHSSGAYTEYSASKAAGDYRLQRAPRVKRVLYPMDERLIPAYYIELFAGYFDGGPRDAFSFVVSADDGRVLFRHNLTRYDAFSYNAYADTGGVNTPFDGPLGNDNQPVTAGPGGPFPRNPAALNVVTLQNGPISTNDPWLPPGATVTTGNNVDAYVDLDGFDDNGPDDGFTPGGPDFRAAATAPNVFNYPYAPDTDPTTSDQRNFAIVNLFYLNNWLHDFWYDNGMDEASGNAQQSNFGRGGVEGDPIHAEGQDASGRNNANMSTPSDGDFPRMQMFLFDGPVMARLTVNAPPELAGDLGFGVAAFGPQSFDVTGDVVLVDDGVAANTNGCEAPFVNAADIAGKIALIDRGACTFVTKVKNAQDAGATGVIVANRQGADLITMGGDDPSITIPAMMVSFEDGQNIRNAASTVNVTLHRDPSIDRDGTVDNGIIAHEWFHYVSNRLIGDANGLINQQGNGMGEGWSDFSTLMLTVRPEDRLVPGNEQFQGAYSTGTYVDDNTYFGIRRAPYSTDMNVFPMTFQHVSDGVPLPATAPIAFGQDGANNSEVHNTGEIWADTLWEIYAAFLNDPRFTFEQAQDRMKSDVIAALKFTPIAPTILEARDAMLAVALASDQQDFELMATAFAKRGMGVGAVGPARFDDTNGGAVDSFVALAGGYVVEDVTLDFAFDDGTQGFCDLDGALDADETAQVMVKIRSNGTRPITAPITATLSSADGDFSFPDGDTITFMPLGIGEEATGSALVKLNSATPAQVVQVAIAFPDVGADPDAVIEPPSEMGELIVNFDLQKAFTADDVERTPAAEGDWTRDDLIGFSDEGQRWQVTGDLDPFFGTGQVWFGPDNGFPSDITLTSPVLQVSATGNFTVTFDHFFQMEFFDVIDGTPVGFDGGVIEVSVNGAPFRDAITDLGATVTQGNGYNGRALVFSPEAQTVDEVRPAFVDTNFDPNRNTLQETVTLDFGNALAGKSVRLRFREGSDVSVGDFGWAVDNITVSGIDNLPFSDVIANSGVCVNRPPHAFAGEDITSPTRAPGQADRKTITLNGSALDQDGTTDLSFQWTQTAGPAVTLTGADTATPSFLAPPIGTQGTLTFGLTVIDGDGVTHDNDAVTVTLTNNPPAANAGPDQEVKRGSPITLNGSGSSDPNGGPLTFSWRQLSGPAVTLTGADTAMPTFTPDNKGARAFELTVSDDDGATSKSTTTVNVKGGGGGALDWRLLMLLLPAAWLRRRRAV